MPGTGGGGRVGEGGFSAECRVAAASRWVSSVCTGLGKVVFTGCWSGVGLVFAGADPSYRASMVFVLAGSESVLFVVGALFGV